MNGPPLLIDAVAALDLDADGERMSGEQAFKLLHRAPELRSAAASSMSSSR
jgi:hypothetical protein